jgi:hypothetical protein
MNTTTVLEIAGALGVLGTVSGAVEAKAKPGGAVYRVATFLASFLPDLRNAFVGAFGSGTVSK